MFFPKKPRIQKTLISMCIINLIIFITWFGWRNDFTNFIRNFSDKKTAKFNNDVILRKSLVPTKEAWKCKMPDKNPWHLDLLAYLNPLEPGPMDTCVPSIVEMTQFVPFPDKTGYQLSVRDTFSKEHKCIYRCLLTINDYQFSQGESIELKAPVQPPCDIIEVECFKDKVEKAVYTNLYYQIYRPPEEETSTQKPSVLEKSIKNKRQEKGENIERKEKGFGVHLLVLDSVSRSQFMRSLPKTMYLLREEFEAIPFHHLNKVGLNSMPNAFAFLFGKRMEPSPKSPLQDEEIPPDPGFDKPTICYKNLDNVPSFIFSIFKKLGYKTMIAEDWARGALNWPNCTGFNTQAADHYMRPFQIRVEIDKNTYEKTHCREHYLFLLEYLQQFLDVYADEQQKFTMTWISELTHNWINQLYHADESLHAMLLDMKNKLEDSFFIIMSDHGLRFGGARSTPTGTTESSHKWEMSHWESEWNASDYKEALHGSSLLHTLTKQPRNCATLSIPYAYCQCDKKYVEIKTSPENNELLNHLAVASVDKLNQEIQKAKYSDKCASLSLDDAKDRVLKVEKLEMEQFETTNPKESKLITANFMITFQTKPGGGKFSGFLRADYQEENIGIRRKGEAPAIKRVNSIEFISDQFERINSHGDQSQCAANQLKIRPYCYCKNY